jgi:hypothetical protein
MSPILSRTIALLFTIFSGCSNWTKSPPVKPKPAPVKAISPKFFFPNSDELKKDLLAKMMTVKKGDKIEVVVQKLGDVFSTAPYDLGEIDEKYGTRLIYNLTDSHGVYEDIVFWFGNDDRLVKVTNTIAEGPLSPPEKRHTKEIDLANLTRPDSS